MLEIEKLKKAGFSFEEVLEIQEGINDINSGKTTDSEVVFNNLYKKINFNNFVNVKA